MLSYTQRSILDLPLSRLLYTLIYRPRNPFFNQANLNNTAKTFLSNIQSRNVSQRRLKRMAKKGLLQPKYTKRQTEIHDTNDSMLVSSITTSTSSKQKSNLTDKFNANKFPSENDTVEAKQQQIKTINSHRFFTDSFKLAKKISDLASRGQLNEAIELVDSHKSNKVANEIVYNHLMTLLNKHSMSTKVDKVYKKVKRKKSL